MYYAYDKRKMDDIVCYNCKRIGHYVNHCPFDKEIQKELPKLPFVDKRSDYRRDSHKSDRRDRHY